MLDDNIKIGIKETIFVFRLISSIQHGQGEIFGNVYEVTFYKNDKYIKKFCNWVFMGTHSNGRFFLIG